jgi:hypothetical protein
MTILIPGDAGYSHAHYGYQDDDPRRPASCGRPTAMGECRWPQEPGTPWCNSHANAFLASAKAAGYVTSDQIRWLAAQTALSPEFTEALVRRWERDFMTPAQVQAQNEAAHVKRTPRRL